ncbi:MAG: hypothetical protein A2381_10325 [Bdellovibrionales bacterium RIFOXYB1_FULL_37_110]|nr:MAG: hypothetical protein A2417_02840 [Bdellovibrionales bacterium RIFOXYC1_FULL_37_79]OFZ61159.1 MAG: hypothetical protein A2381_10325 [Bdellovibrionales bacterium RIFOXYB1_FULL_37_110]OFZ65610.1 MAG: hypothetical protein A2577_02510 [Bdellovibrionales bacterium RIFOXYD1_FULL_36_51]
MNRYWIFIFIFLVMKNAWAYKEFDSNILNECQDNVAIMGALAECNDMYHLYPPLFEKEKRLNIAKDKGIDEIKLGGFNVFNMTTGQTKYKDLEIIADIISQWDVVGAVEVLPAMGDDAKTNVLLRSMLDQGKISLEEARKAYRTPGYLNILNLLRKKYPESNWAMILAPYTQSKTQELVAYYYRGDSVELIESSHCKNEVYELLQKPTILNWDSTGKISYKEAVLPPKNRILGCIPYFEENIEQQFARIPFMASFKAGAFDFTLLAMHARFRAPSELNNVCQKDCMDAIKKMLDEEFDPEGCEVPTLSSTLLAKVLKQVKAHEAGQNKDYLSAEEKKLAEVQAALKISANVLERRLKYLIDPRVFTRFYETKKLLQFINTLKKDGEKDIILMGDFNLENKELVKNKVDYWSEILGDFPGHELLVTDKTSLSRDKKGDGMVSSYDHFLLVPEDVSECRPSTAHAFDFRQEKSFLDANLPNRVGQYIVESKALSMEEIIAEYRTSLKDVLVFKGSGAAQRLEKITDHEIDTEVAEFQRRVFGTQSVEKFSQMFLQEIISDHLPISMTCVASPEDDD